MEMQSQGVRLGLALHIAVRIGLFTHHASLVVVLKVILLTVLLAATVVRTFRTSCVALKLAR
jgi:hypothetical protein